MGDVWATNDRIDPRPVVQVGPEALVHLAASGWYEVDPPPEQTTEELDADLLAAAGYGPDPDPSEASEAPEPVDYTGWLKADLVAEAEARGLDTTGTKDDLIGRLDGNDVTATEPEPPGDLA